MLISQIVETGFPELSIFDKVGFALNMCDDYDLLHLPVTAEQKFVGIVSKNDLLDAREDSSMASLQHQLIKASVLPEDYFLNALKLASHFNISVVPAVNKNGEIEGIITQKNLVRSLASFLNVEEQGAIIVLEMDKRNFSFGELSRLIETNDASITQLNTYTESPTGLFIVTIKITRVEVSAIIATLQRYDYTIRSFFGEEYYQNQLKENYDLLMAYLRV